VGGKTSTITNESLRPTSSPIDYVNTKNDQQLDKPVRGYLEGYYGKLFSWSERSDLLRFIASVSLNTYCYAPKEDAQHRLHWREPYNTKWRNEFSHFSTLASELDINVVAGIAPGLDYSFTRKDNTSDFNQLLKKANDLINDGAKDILVLWDDIDEDCYVDRNGLSEGTAHARVINQLSESIGRPVWAVPRVYAAEIDNRNNYLEDFFTELQPQQTVLLCGNAIVARKVSLEGLCKLSSSPIGSARDNDSNNGALKHRAVVWDNFYANDYCPRRLFLGPWTGRQHINHYLLNPTGLPFTDQVLLDIAVSTQSSVNSDEDWTKALSRHGVPDAFLTLAPYFTQPFFGDRDVLGDPRDIDFIEPGIEVEQAIEECLWKWKSPLAREWYPFIFGLKHDLALTHGLLPRDRVLKTQTPALAKRLLR